MPQPKGVSGNPRGRPPKNRALTEILEKAGAAQVDINGDKVSGKRLLARLLWEGATTGIVTFAADRTYALPVDQWVGLVRFLYQQVDGPPKQDIEVAGIVTHVIEVELGKPTERDGTPQTEPRNGDTPAA